MMTIPKTNWIWTPDWTDHDKSQARIVYFRKTVEISDDAAKAPFRIRISADSRYKLYVNGAFVQDGPQKALDLKEWFVDEADLANYLHPGKNTVAVEVLRYPEPNLAFGAPVSNDSLLRSPIPHLYIEGLERAACLDGKSGWKASVNREITVLDEESQPAPIHAQEEVHATEKYAGWMENSYDESSWNDALARSVLDIPTSDAPGNLVPRTIPYMKHTAMHFTGVMEVRQADRAGKEQVKAEWEAMLAGGGFVEIPAHTTEIVEISSDVEECGFLHYAFEGGKGAKVTTLCAECYAYPPEDGVANGMPIKGDRTDSVRGRLYGHTSSYTAAGYGNETQPETYEPFWFRTFRYIQLKIETNEAPLRIDRFDYTETGYPLEAKTAASVSDPSFAPIWDISLRTLKRCMHDTYMDCPFYEQLQYAMDGREEILYTYAVSADDRLARQAIEAFRRSQRPDGLTNSDAPTQKSNVIPGFSIYYILMVYDHMMYFGDRELVRRNWGAIDQVLEFFGRHIAENGMVGKIGGPLIGSTYWSFIDWTNEWNQTMGVPSSTNKGTGALTMESLLYAYGLEKAAEMSDFIGRTGVAEEYRSRARSVLDAVKKHAMGTYTDAQGHTSVLLEDGPGVKDFSVHPQVFAVLTGLVTPEEGRKMLEVTIGNPDMAQSSVSYMFYLFRALEMTGWYEKTDDLWELWRKMVREHMSTCVENGTDSRSDCHAWSALMLYELPCAVLGVTPAAPGFRKMNIHPHAGALRSAKGDVITPVGTVHVEWSLNPDGEMSLSYQAPDGVEVMSPEN